jgi:tetratricopeptide (TPR) repeat protein
LAAARLKTLRAEEIAARLDDRFHLLTGGNRAALPRQQTLRATIEWSYNLLSDAERVLLQRLSVFAGGWALEAAQSVCSDVGQDASLPYNILDLLTRLADKSLVNVERAQGQETYYRMLETIRQYAREKLIESGEEAALRQRHLDYYVQLAERAEPELVSFDQFAWLDRLESEFDNIRTALEWSLTTDIESGLRLISALRWFWITSTHANESSGYLSRLLQLSVQEVVAPVIRAKALAVLSEMLLGRSEIVWARQLVEESLELCHATGDEQGEALALEILGAVLLNQGSGSEATQLFERCLALSRAHNDHIRTGEALLRFSEETTNLLRHAQLLQEAHAIFLAQGHWVGLALTLNDQSQLAIWQGDYALARRWIKESKELTQRARALAGQLAFGMIASGRLALHEGDYIRARIELEESAHLLQETGQRLLSFWAMSDLGYVALRQGDWQRAHHLWVQSMHSFRESSVPSGVVYSLEGLASLGVQLGRLACAARLLAWANATRKATSDTRPPVEQADVDRDLAIIRAQLDDATFEAEQEVGRKMTMDEAIAYALEEQG